MLVVEEAHAEERDGATDHRRDHAPGRALEDARARDEQQQGEERQVQEQLEPDEAQRPEAPDAEGRVHDPDPRRDRTARAQEVVEPAQRERAGDDLGDRELGEERQRGVDRGEHRDDEGRARARRQLVGDPHGEHDAEPREQQQRPRLALLPGDRAGHRHPDRVQRVEVDRDDGAGAVHQVDADHGEAVVDLQQVAAQAGAEAVDESQRAGARDLDRHVRVQALVLTAAEVGEAVDPRHRAEHERDGAERAPARQLPADRQPGCAERGDRQQRADAGRPRRGEAVGPQQRHAREARQDDPEHEHVERAQ